MFCHLCLCPCRPLLFPLRIISDRSLSFLFTLSPPQALFDVLDDEEVYEQSEVHVSYLQVYNNEIQDLQSEDMVSLPIQKVKGSHKVKNLIRKHVDSAFDAATILEEGNKSRVFRSHKMNDMSSRSHAVSFLYMYIPSLLSPLPSPPFISSLLSIPFLSYAHFSSFVSLCAPAPPSSKRSLSSTSSANRLVMSEVSNLPCT